jgi:phosphoribosylaminoimidazolecarboxamide formyltransferase/IMP cyclohydrolase
MRKDALSTMNVGDHPYKMKLTSFFRRKDPQTQEEKDYLEETELPKVGDLRYGTNPSQTAALYNPRSFLGSLNEERTGKEGASQTNMEDIFYAAVMVGYFDNPAVMINKHENPSGFATAYEPEPLWMTYKKAVDADFRAAFGGTAFLNRPIDIETAEAIIELFTEVVIAPGFETGVMDKFKGTTRVFEYNDEKFKSIPRYTGDKFVPEIKVLSDGSTFRSDTFLLPIRNEDELRQYVVSRRQPTDSELRDILTGVRLNKIRSNSIRLIKNGYTPGLGVSQQDRVMCIDIAAYKNRKLKDLHRLNVFSKRYPRVPEIIAEYLSKIPWMVRDERAADYSIPGSVLVSDGFFPFTDSIKLAKKLGVTAVLAPHGGNKFNSVLAKADEFGIAFVDLPDYMRFFEHH